MKNNEIVDKLIALGKIPNESEMTDDTFKAYDELICSFEEALTFEEAEKLIDLFSEDCSDLNWGLIHLIETVPYNEIERYKELISKCPLDEWREIFEIRFNNWLNKQ